MFSNPMRRASTQMELHMGLHDDYTKQPAIKSWSWWGLTVLALLTYGLALQIAIRYWARLSADTHFQLLLVFAAIPFPWFCALRARKFLRELTPASVAEKAATNSLASVLLSYAAIGILLALVKGLVR